MITRCLLFISLFSFLVMQLYGQITAPEQDCIHAIVICDSFVVQNQSYAGIGDIADVSSISSCLENAENNSVWYVFTISVSGVLEFSIIPHEGDDYDFALFNLSGHTCADLYDGGLQVRCSYAFSNGPTGLQTGATDSTENSGGYPFVLPLNVQAGETYALLVDNFGSNPGGFSIDFHPSANSTASVVPGHAQRIDSVIAPGCTDSGIVVVFNKAIDCNTLSQNFSIASPPGVNIINTICGHGSVMLIPSSLAEGNYTILFDPAPNGLPLRDGCGTPFTNPDSLSVFIPELSRVHAGFTYTCDDASVFSFTNTSSGDSVSLAWSFGDGGSSTEEHPEHTYPAFDSYQVTLIAQNRECMDTISRFLEVLDNFRVQINPYINDLPLHTPTFFEAVSYPTTAEGFFWSIDNASFAESPQGRRVTYTFTTSGEHTVCVAAIRGCYVDTTCLTLSTFATNIGSPEAKHALPFDVFPNPAMKVIWVKMPNITEMGTATVHNLLGEKILTATFSTQQFELDLRDYPSGTYLLKVETEKSVGIKRLVKR